MPNKLTFEDLEKRVRDLEQTESKCKHLLKQLNHSHGLMDYIISHARSSIAIHDRDLKYLYVSKRYLEEYKIKEQNVIGKHHYEVFPDLPKKWRDVHQRSLAGEVVSAEEDPYHRMDGSIDWTRWECDMIRFQIVDPDGTQRVGGDTHVVIGRPAFEVG